MSNLAPRPIDRLLAPLGAFFAHKLAGAGLLLGAALLALVWAASPWGDLYRAALHTPAAVSVGGVTVAKSVHHWINDGLMAFFFFVVGLELKREVLAGGLSTPAKAALPILGALGGMLMPAAIYAAVNVGQPTISTGISRSRTSRRTTCSCCQSFSPNIAASGRHCSSSFVTIVAMPAKWPGRAAPHRQSVSPSTLTRVA